jgi:uncharacterized protein YggL (DUF469 family)
MRSTIINVMFENLRAEKAEDAAERCIAGVENTRRLWLSGGNASEINAYVCLRRVVD